MRNWVLFERFRLAKRKIESEVNGIKRKKKREKGIDGWKGKE